MQLRQRILYYYRRLLGVFSGRLSVRRFRSMRWLLPLLLVAVLYFDIDSAMPNYCVADATNYHDLRSPWNGIDDHDLCDYPSGFIHVPEYRLCCYDLTLQPSEAVFIVGRLFAEFIAVSFVHLFCISVVYMVK